MKVSVEFDERRPCEGATIRACDGGSIKQHRRIRDIDDPADVQMQDPDDPADVRMQDPDDPADVRMQDPDDPADVRMQDPDDPAVDSNAFLRRLEGGCGHSASPGARSLGHHTTIDHGAPSPVKRSYSDFIIVRLSELVPATAERSLLEAARTLGLPGLVKALEGFGEPDSRPAISESAADEYGSNNTCSEPVTLGELEQRARQSAFPPLHSLRSYWRLDARDLTVLKANAGSGQEEATRRGGLPYSADEAARLLVKRLNALSEVDLAYREIAASDPTLTAYAEPSGEELSDFQLYLDRAPHGLDARWAREHLNGTNDLVNGTSDKVTVADLEQGWVHHEDLDPELFSVRKGLGDNRHAAHSGMPHAAGDYQGFHGTAVLSSLAARSMSGSGALGVVGIAEGVGDVVTASHYQLDGSENATGDLPDEITTGTNGHVAAAIEALLVGEHLKAGDLLLIEVQRGGLPVELVDPLDFDAIRLATGNGVIVIEAAGNGGHNLDRWRTRDGWVFDRESGSFIDSGAILVGAARSVLPHNRASFSSYGSRVDCFAWGDGVVAAGYGDFLGGAEQNVYTDRFSGTSSASALIAGAATLVQGLYQENASPASPGNGVPEEGGWSRLSPLEMRSLLSDPNTGTRQGPQVAGHIGVMPDLRAILTEALSIVPRLYLRDHVGDTGDRSTAAHQRCFASPDIIVGDHFEGGPRDERSVPGHALLPERATATASNISVGLCNRGLGAAKNVDVKLYRAPLATLVTPDCWRPIEGQDVGGDKISSIKVAEVAQGDSRVVSEPMIVAPEDVKNSCLIAVASYKRCPEPPLPHSLACSWSQYLDMLRSNGNVAVHNVHSIEVPEVGLVSSGFCLNGTTDASRRFEFRLIQRLPEEVSVCLRLPLALALKFARRRLWKVERDVNLDGTISDEAVLHIPKDPRFVLGRVVLPAAVRFPRCTLEWHDASAISSDHSFAIQQLYQGEEVGRITWEFRDRTG